MLADRLRLKTRVPSDPLWSSVVALLHCDGANGSTSFPDVTGRTWTPGGNAKISTAQSVFGGASALFDGNGDYIAAPNPTLYGVDFTVEGRIQPTSIGISQVVFTTYRLPVQAGAVILRLEADNRMDISEGTKGSTGTTILAANTWYSFALVYSATSKTLSLFINGALDASLEGTVSTGYSSMFFGGSPGDNNLGTRWWNGYMDELRITKAARYSSNYTPDSAPFPNS